MFNLRVFCISSSQSHLWKRKLPARILEKWTEEASPPATLKKRLRTLPYGACLSPKLFSCGEAAMWSFWDYQSSHRRLLHKSMAELLSQQWSSPRHPSIGKPLLDPLFQQILPYRRHLPRLLTTIFIFSTKPSEVREEEIYRQDDRVMSQGCKYLKEAWEKGGGACKRAHKILSDITNL